MSPDEHTLTAFLEQGKAFLEAGNARFARLCAIGAIAAARETWQDSATEEEKLAMDRVTAAAAELLEEVSVMFSDPDAPRDPGDG